MEWKGEGKKTLVNQRPNRCKLLKLDKIKYLDLSNAVANGCGCIISCAILPVKNFSILRLKTTRPV
jgi:hypothetical protein